MRGDFKWRHLVGETSLWAVHRCCNYGVNRRDLEAMMEERSGRAGNLLSQTRPEMLHRFAFARLSVLLSYERLAIVTEKSTGNLTISPFGCTSRT
jgi:hypothetical protein